MGSMNFLLNLPQTTLVSTFLITGTGSTFALENISQWQHHIEQRSALSFENSMGYIDARTVKEHLENIRIVLCPLAQVLDVSRQAIYKWLASNASPEADKFERIKNLSKVADILKRSGISRTQIILKIKNIDGMSLFDLLKNKQPYESHLKALVAECLAMETAYLQSGVSQSRSKPSKDWLFYLSIPTYPES
jgi:transcriptional regulator with XRE-family HTH domain